MLGGGDELDLTRNGLIDVCLEEESALRSEGHCWTGRRCSRFSEFCRLKVACRGRPIPTGLTGGCLDASRSQATSLVGDCRAGDSRVDD